MHAPFRPSYADLAGYMPIRRDFDIEHDNEAEHLLTGVEFLASDYPAETAMKLSVVRWGDYIFSTFSSSTLYHAFYITA